MNSHKISGNLDWLSRGVMYQNISRQTPPSPLETQARGFPIVFISVLFVLPIYLSQGSVQYFVECLTLGMKIMFFSDYTLSRVTYFSVV
jgi:hypothetical protein